MEYAGSELEVFEIACRWKKYYSSLIRSYLHGAVLEVGAGLGGTTRVLCGGQHKEWTCLEPDEKLAESIRAKIAIHENLKCCHVITGTMADIPDAHDYDVILYVDVLEHIEDDIRELRLASRHLREDGRLIIVAPAHNGLYSRFDKAIGHHRRYNRKSLASIVPDHLRLEKMVYLDSAGLLASYANKLFLKQDLPSRKQIVFWDSILIPLSGFLDRLFCYRVGKTVLGVWRRVI